MDANKARKKNKTVTKVGHNVSLIFQPLNHSQIKVLISQSPKFALLHL